MLDIGVSIGDVEAIMKQWSYYVIDCSNYLLGITTVDFFKFLCTIIPELIHKEDADLVLHSSLMELVYEFHKRSVCGYAKPSLQYLTKAAIVLFAKLSIVVDTNVYNKINCWYYEKFSDMIDNVKSNNKLKKKSQDAHWSLYRRREYRGDLYAYGGLLRTKWVLDFALATEILR